MAKKDKNNVPVDANAQPDKKDKANKKANDKPGFFARLGAKFKGLKTEFKKVTWASRKSTFKNFGIVLSIVVVFALVIGLVDLGLGSLFNWLLKVIDF